MRTSVRFGASILRLVCLSTLCAAAPAGAMELSRLSLDLPALRADEALPAALDFGGGGAATTRPAETGRILAEAAADFGLRLVFGGLELGLGEVGLLGALLGGGPVALVFLAAAGILVLLHPLLDGLVVWAIANASGHYTLDLGWAVLGSYTASIAGALFPLLALALASPLAVVEAMAVLGAAVAAGGNVAFANALKIPRPAREAEIVPAGTAVALREASGAALPAASSTVPFLVWTF